MRKTSTAYRNPAPAITRLRPWWKKGGWLLLLAAGCAPTGSPVPVPPPDDGSSATAAAASIGAPLYEGQPVPQFPPLRVGPEPIIIPNCFVQYEERQQVSAEVDGRIELLAAPLTRRPDGRYEWPRPDGPPILYDPERPHPNIVFHPRDPQRQYPYWRLQEGDFVQAGQTVCLLDDQLIQTRREAAEKNRLAAQEVREQAQKGADFAQRKIDLYKNNPDVIPQSTILDDRIMLSRFLENLAQVNQQIVKAEQELKEADLLIQKHRVTATVSGIIRNIARWPGEYVRAGDKILEIQSTDKVRLEGQLDVQYAARLRRHMTVSVEPTLPTAPLMTLSAHRQPVAGVAVSGHAERPLVVSVGLDGTAVVWDPNLSQVAERSSLGHNLPHPAPVRSVACTPPGAPRQLVVTGAEDGRLRIWDIDDPEHLPAQPKVEAEPPHVTGIGFVAISPDGRYAASAAGREVWLWALPSGERLYALPPDHRDTVTSLAFNPQGQLVTASRDRTLKVWKLGREGAALTRTLEHRAGLLDVLGLSPDGARVLFDHDKSRLDLLQLDSGQTVGQVINFSPHLGFATLALFQPQTLPAELPPEQWPPYTLATVGGEGDLKGTVQLWHLPRSGGRAAEIARLIPPGRVAITAAAFSPPAATPFFVLGTDKGTVHLWTLPKAPPHRQEGRIVTIDAADPRSVTVRVEMDNRALRLLDKSTATVIVPPPDKLP
ncbi:HlyD family efflux transporter periplasmic adaptor subunit [Thermogemmata fonticola]|uniref:HlyD family efflux transporter periplasmic adaptor subunit n=1 Tax=Thermogemmata fonticola TaxID=2755323 RepID=A0A7V8VGX2_9BACT|nr:HlyD family efflux transporter periplasmic adaptor subunit [Thermogemmata fonticola]MBA2227834.1 HlyD family efflux transporter periplasmic adaptor subunit [Thermogemmata fonticola]